MAASGETTPQSALSVRDVAELLNVSESYVRRHDELLGRLHSLPGVVRYDRARVESLLSAGCTGKRSPQAPSPGAEPKPTRQRRAELAPGIALLPIRGER